MDGRRVRTDGGSATVCEGTFDDELGAGSELTVERSPPGDDLVLRWTLRSLDDAPTLLMRLQVTNQGDQPVALSALLSLTTDGEGAGWQPSSPLDGLLYLKMGQHSWKAKSLCPLHEDLEAEMLTAVGDRRQRGIVLGFATFRRFSGRIEGHPRLGALLSLAASHSLRGFPLAPGQGVSSEWLYVDVASNVLEGLERWAQIAGELSGAVFADPPAAGFYTWYYYKMQVSEEVMLKNARFFAGNRDRFPVDYMHLDFGWQREGAAGENRTTDQFPHGLGWLAGEIRELGFVPSLWLNAFMYEHPPARVVGEHPEFFQHDAECELISSGQMVAAQQQGTERRQYRLDPTSPAARGFLTERYQWAKALGFGMVMLDFVDKAVPHENAVMADNSLSEVEAVRAGLDAVRQAVGEEVMVLGCGTPYAPMVGIGNLVRVAVDVAATWHHIFKASLQVLMQYYMHNRLWTNYIDCLCVRGKASPFWPEEFGVICTLSLDEARFYAAVTGLSGSAVMIAEDVEVLAPERQWLLSLLLPIYDKGRFRPVDLFRERLPRTLELAVEEGGRSWVVAAGLNWHNEEGAHALELDRLQLNPGTRYHAFDIFEQRYLGCLDSQAAIGPVAPHGARLVNLVPDSGRPQLVGTDLHIAQGAVEVAGETWDATRRQLRIKLSGLEARRGHLWVWIPDGLRSLTVGDSPVESICHGSARLLRVGVVLDRPKMVSLKFEKQE